MTAEQPFYKRWLGLGGSEDASAAPQPSSPAPAAVPTPPRRQVSGTAPDRVAMAPAQ